MFLITQFYSSKMMCRHVINQNEFLIHSLSIKNGVTFISFYGIKVPWNFNEIHQSRIELEDRRFHRIRNSKSMEKRKKIEEKRRKKNATEGKRIQLKKREEKRTTNMKGIYRSHLSKKQASENEKASGTTLENISNGIWRTWKGTEKTREKVVKKTQLSREKVTWFFMKIDQLFENHWKMGRNEWEMNQKLLRIWWKVKEFHEKKYVMMTWHNKN